MTAEVHIQPPARTVGRITVIVALAVAVAVAGCGAASDSTADAPVPAETMSAPATSTSSTSATAATTTAPATVGSTDWAPACSSLDVQGGTELKTDAPGLDHFGPLGAAATMIIDVPSTRSIDGTGEVPPAVSTSRIPGGILLLSTGSSKGAATSSILAAIDHTGTKRWVRCIDFRVDDVQVDPGADIAYLRSDNTTMGSDVEAIEVVLADGTVSATDPLPGTTAEQPLVEWQGIHVIGDTESLSGVAADGTVAWRRDDLTLTSLEGSRIATDDAVTAVTVCTTPTGPDGWCVPAVIGLDTTTGKTLWTLDGFRSIAHADNGHLLASSGPLFDDDHNFQAQGWTLFDDRTGAPLAGQHWDDPATFETACCADGEFIWTQRHGAIVVATAETTVSVWYPESLSTTTEYVAIP